MYLEEESMQLEEESKKLDEKSKEFDEKFQSAAKEKETLERQIAFHEKYIVPRLEPGAELRAEMKFLASLKSDYSEALKRADILEKTRQVEQSREFDFGWKKKAADELPGKSSGSLSTHSSEMEALRIIGQEGGETNFGVVSRKLGREVDYARLLCMSLARADYIDITPGGRCKITPKGEKELEKKGFAAWL